MMRLLILFVACSAFASGQSIFQASSAFPPRTLDPIMANDEGHFRCFAQIFESPLDVAINEKGHCVIAPGVTQLPVISDGGLVLTFAMTPNVRFSDDPCFEGRRTKTEGAGSSQSKSVTRRPSRALIATTQPWPMLRSQCKRKHLDVRTLCALSNKGLESTRAARATTKWRGLIGHGP